MRDVRMKKCPTCGSLHYPMTALLGSEEVLAQRVKRELATMLEGCSEYTWRLFVTMIEAPMPFATASQLCKQLSVEPSTLTSRFFRSRLPSPKTFLAGWKMVRLAEALEEDSLSISQVALQLGFSSGQSCIRFVRETGSRVSGLALAGGVNLRNEHDGMAMWGHVRDTLFVPNLAVLTDRRFKPLIDPSVPAPRVSVTARMQEREKVRAIA